VLTVVNWLMITGELGVGSATVKRLSEDHDSGEFLAAAGLWIAALGVVFSAIVLAFQPVFESYIDDFDEYIAISVVWFLVLLLFVKLGYKTTFRVLEGERKVHLAAMLETTRQGGRSVLQIALVLAGYSLLGMLIGYAVAGVLIGMLGLYLMKTRPKRPTLFHFRSLFDYAKYSWLGKMKSRIFNDIDILILGVFVPSAAVGIYAVAWSLSKFLQLFSSAISSTMFPEISHKSTQEKKDAVAGLIEDSLAFTGLIVIPGFVGGLLLAEELMQIYGPEFVEGATVLGLLIFAILLYSYQKQLVNALNGVDRPDLAFRVNLVFAAVNASLNVVLIWQYGIEGAAVASVLSVVAGLSLAYYYANRLLTFHTPIAEIGRQAFAAGLMGAVIVGLHTAIEATAILQHNIVIVLVLVSIGAGLYFLTLLVLSSRLRSTIERNLPVDVPYLSGQGR